MSLSFVLPFFQQWLNSLLGDSSTIPHEYLKETPCCPRTSCRWNLPQQKSDYHRWPPPHWPGEYWGRGPSPSPCPGSGSRWTSETGNHHFHQSGTRCLSQSTKEKYDRYIKVSWYWKNYVDNVSRQNWSHWSIFLHPRIKTFYRYMYRNTCFLVFLCLSIYTF